MLVVTYSDACKTLASILDRAQREGAVLIRRADGSVFRIAPERIEGSPLDIPALPIQLPEGELAGALEDARASSDPARRGD